jgi:hypothetical protein
MSAIEIRLINDSNPWFRSERSQLLQQSYVLVVLHSMNNTAQS